MFSLRLVCLAIFAACILAMSPCELPESFQTELSQVNLNGTCATQYSMGQLYFDYAHQLLRIDIAGTDLSSTSFTASIFQDYNSMTQYVFDREHDVCVSNSLNGSMDKPVIPSSANLQGNHLSAAVVTTRPADTSSSYRNSRLRNASRLELDSRW